MARSTDAAVKTILRARGRSRGDLSRFVEDAVNREIMRDTVTEIRARSASLDNEEIGQLIDRELSEVGETVWRKSRAIPSDQS